MQVSKLGWGSGGLISDGRNTAYCRYASEIKQGYELYCAGQSKLHLNGYVIKVTKWLGQVGIAKFCRPMTACFDTKALNCNHMIGTFSGGLSSVWQGTTRSNQTAILATLE
jgi:hypothetical protein